MGTNESKTKHFFVAALILLNGCVAYYPQVVDIPLIKDKNDLRINAGLFVVPDINGNFDNQVYENENDMTESFGLLGMHITATGGVTDFLSVQGYASIDFAARFHLQAALGAYHAFENKMVMEIYGGCGYGNGYMNSLFTVRDNYLLPFSQFNIGKSGIGSANIDYGLGFKGGYLFCNFDNRFNQTVIHKKDGWIIEPSAFFRIGGKRAKYCRMVNYMWTKSVSDDYYFPVNVGMSVNLNLGKRSE